MYAAVESIVRNEAMEATAVCDMLGVSRSAYYAWRSREPSAREARDVELAPLVREVFWKHRRRYGVRRIVAELAERGESCGTRRIAKLLQNQGLSAIQPKSFVPKTTDSRHRLGYSPNLLLDTSEPSSINDGGGQYASTRYREILRRANIRQSMSRADNCYDNAFMESAFGTFKTELEMTEYDHQRAARCEIGDYIAYYNLERKHSALGYRSPHQFELLQIKKLRS